MTGTERRRYHAPPLRFDWRRRYIWDVLMPPRIVYVCQPHESTALQVWRTGSASWSWIAIDVQTRVVVRSGAAGSMARAKLAAENAVDLPPEPTLWTTVPPSDDLPF